MTGELRPTRGWLVAVLAGVATAIPWTAAALEPHEWSELAPLAVHSLLLGVCRAGPERLVAVGERGHVLVSGDGGATWVQKKAPTRATLTAVYFADAAHGWAVGHDEVILRTGDGGESWTLVHEDAQSQQPLLDVWFKDANTGYAIGAYSTVLASSDGGASWAPAPFAPRPVGGAPTKGADATLRDDEGVAQPHLYAIAPGRGARLYLAGEAGHLYRSDDGGTAWRELASPYAGSFFGLVPLAGEALLAFGLRGHLYLTEDGGQHFRTIETHTGVQLAGGARFADGGVVLIGLSGVVLYSADGAKFELHQEADRKGFSAVAVAGENVVLVGEDGARRLSRAALVP